MKMSLQDHPHVLPYIFVVITRKIFKKFKVVLIGTLVNCAKNYSGNYLTNQRMR